MDELPKVKEVMEMLRSSRPDLQGKLVVVDEDTGDYVIGDEVEETIERARVKYPTKMLHLRRVGGTVYFIGGLGWKHVI